MLFDSEGKAAGLDYSRWNDVYLTLQGKYGTRSTRSDPADDASAVMHVAAPVRDGERIIGVLTVAIAVGWSRFFPALARVDRLDELRPAATAQS